MPTETLQNVLDAARGWLSDNITVPTGEIYTNAVLLAVAFPTAYRELVDSMGISSRNRVRRHFYYTLPPYTSELHPASVGLVDVAEPEKLEERDSTSVITITSTDTSTPIQVTTSAPHGLATNDEVIITGVSSTQAPWGRWFVTVTGASTLTLNGSVSDGNAGTGGTISTSSDKFTDVRAVDDLDEGAAIAQHLGEYAWEENILRFRGASLTRQLHLIYVASGTPPTNPNTVIGYDNALNFLGCRTAGLAAHAKEFYTQADRLNRLALGPEMDARKPSGYLGDFIHLQVLEMQRTQRRRGRFRKSQNNSEFTLS